MPRLRSSLHRPKPIRWYVVAAAVLSSCASVDGNLPPQWTAPEDPLLLGQGQTRSVAFLPTDPDGDPVTIEQLEVPAGLEGEIVDDRLVLRPDYELEGPAMATIDLSDGKGGDVELGIDLDIRALDWLENHEWSGAAGPEAREHGSVLVDRANSQIFVFHGSGYSPQFEQMLDDVWRFDVDDGTWSEVAPLGDLPPGAGSRRIAGAAGATVAYAFGGYGPPPATYGDLYRITIEDGTLRWREIEQENPPPARYLHSFVYDHQTDRFALFGGVASGIFGDTWTMNIEDDVAVWREVETESGPSPRYGFFYGFDEALGRMVLFSGAQQGVVGNPVNAADDSWSLDLRADPPVWSLIDDGSSADAPPGRRNGCGVFDPTGPRLFVFGGTSDAATTQEGLFVLDTRPGKEGWTRLSISDAPDARSSGFGVFDGRSAWVGFGNGSGLYRDWSSLGH